jgi:hypothetical protein
MDRLVFVVRRDRETLHEMLTHALASELWVSVVLDRRGRDRRERDESHPIERRRWDRRLRPLNDHELRERGWTIVRVPD